MLQRIIGIDIGSYSVKAALIERGFRSFSFVEFYERRIQSSDLLTPEESTAVAIQGLIDDHNLSWDVACVGFPSQRVTSRLLTFPFSSSAKIDQTIQFEIESYIPFNVDDVVVDYHVVWHAKDASRVMVIYVQKKDLVKEVSMFSTVNIDPRFICLEGVELVNLVNLGMVPPEGAYAIVDVGHEKTTVTICRGKRLGYIRAISLGGKAITEAIASKMGVPFDEAERMKIEMGRLPAAGEEEMADEITSGIVSAIRSAAEECLLHLRQTFFSYRETEGVPVESIYLCGGTSRLPGFDRFISDTLKLNVTYLNCADFHFTRLERADAHRHVIPQALALALRGTAGGGPDINLRRGEFAFKGDVEQIGGSLRRVGVVVGLVVFLALINFATKYYSVKQQIDKLSNDIVALVHQALPGAPTRALATPKAAISLLKSKEGDVNERMAQLKEMVGTSPLDILKEISTILPPRNEFKVEVSGVDINQDNVTLSGVVDDFKAVDTFRQSLEKSTLFTNITTGDVGKGVRGEIKFKLSMGIAAAVGAGAEKEKPKGKPKEKTKGKVPARKEE